MLNSALSEGSFKLADLQKQTKNLTDEEQALQRDIDAYSSPDALQRRARELGMVPGGDPAFLGPDGKVKGAPSAATPESAAFTDPVAPEAMTPAVRSTSPAAPPAPASPSRSAPAAPVRSAPVTPRGTSLAPSAPAAAVPPPTPQPASTPTPGR